MSKVIRPVRQVLLALGLFGSLGFGVSAAFAEPVKERKQICTFIRDADECRGCCIAGGNGSGAVIYGQCYCS